MNEMILKEKYKALQNDYNDALWNIEHLGKITDEYRDKYNELQNRINKAIKKLNSAIEHYEDEQKDFALKSAIKILKGE